MTLIAPAARLRAGQRHPSEPGDAVQFAQGEAKQVAPLAHVLKGGVLTAEAGSIPAMFRQAYPDRRFRSSKRGILQIQVRKQWASAIAMVRNSPVTSCNGFCPQQEAYTRRAVGERRTSLPGRPCVTSLTASGSTFAGRRRHDGRAHRSSAVPC